MTQELKFKNASRDALQSCILPVAALPLQGNKTSVLTAEGKNTDKKLLRWGKINSKRCKDVQYNLTSGIVRKTLCARTNSTLHSKLDEKINGLY